MEQRQRPGVVMAVSFIATVVILGLFCFVLPQTTGLPFAVGVILGVAVSVATSFVLFRIFRARA